MRILVDADACNKIDEVIKIGKDNSLEVHLFYDSSHDFELEIDCIKHQVSQGADSADYAIINFCLKEDIIITRDGGLAAMVLAKGCYAINTNGLEYDDSNMLAILTSRHLNKKERMKGNRMRSSGNRSGRHYNFKNKLLEIINRKGRKDNNEVNSNDDI